MNTSLCRWIALKLFFLTFVKFQIHLFHFQYNVYTISENKPHDFLQKFVKNDIELDCYKKLFKK